MTPEQPDLFGFDPHAHHQRGGMDTSEAAAHSMEHDARALMMRVLRHLQVYGPATQHELAVRMKLRPDQVWRRLSDLKNQRYIEDSGLRRLGPSHRFQAVWQVR